MARTPGFVFGNMVSGAKSRSNATNWGWRNMTKIKLMAACSLLAIAAAPQTAIANDELVEMQQDAKNWVMPLGNYSGTRYSELDQINKDNVGDLQVAWTFSTGVLRGHEGGPLVIDGVMYVHTPFPNKVFALDLNDNGKIIWSYEPEQDPNVIPVMCCDTVNRGVAYGDGKIILHQADTNVVALDAATGEELWKTANGDPSKGEKMETVIQHGTEIGISEFVPVAASSATTLVSAWCRMILPSPYATPRLTVSQHITGMTFGSCSGS